MPGMFRLFWVRENGCDAGTLLQAGELEPEIRERVLELAAGDPSALTLMLPYMDHREWRKRGEILASLEWERVGNAILPKLAPGEELRNMAANLALADPVWRNAPMPNDPFSFALWQKVSMTLQRLFREWISEEYFRDVAHFEDRDASYAMLLYKAARVCHGKPRGEFTYDLHDYPECNLTVALSVKMTGRALQGILAGVEERLESAGRADLARHYRPVWYQDVTVAVRRKPKLYIELLTVESSFINALIELSIDKTPEGVHRFTKIANQTLRKVYGMNLRHLGVRALGEATGVLIAREQCSATVD